jgi:hypothetical protein
MPKFIYFFSGIAGFTPSRIVIFINNFNIVSFGEESSSLSLTLSRAKCMVHLYLYEPALMLCTLRKVNRIISIAQTMLCMVCMMPPAQSSGGQGCTIPPGGTQKPVSRCDRITPQVLKSNHGNLKQYLDLIT